MIGSRSLLVSAGPTKTSGRYDPPVTTARSNPKFTFSWLAIVPIGLKWRSVTASPLPVKQCAAVSSPRSPEPSVRSTANAVLLYAEAARSAPSLPERDNLTRQAARLNARLRRP